ncbi:hypothetical protein MC7420_7222 [Coleofasciculus chthonoplastes PCC 7420]|uniref:Uncharacterized protein n=1 Tax=Coleofasciculus chthonoplastes PCC 7420 TaxID=118168 RepID=B4VHU9_9CYAN|nr:biotin/lipoyl-binding protein [Coleofasciculus chthonoplastes]EDX78569.1 hypothetical protein MC7420_7222 [Coleofasciculus chthonoplastes PCC 7420]
MNPSINSRQNQLKVVPPQPKPPVQPASDSPALPKPEKRPSVNLKKWLLITAIIAGVGYVTFIPEFPHSVRGEADITSTSNARQDVTLKVAGVIKQIYVKPNQPVRKGDKLVQLESQEIESAIANAQTELGKPNPPYRRLTIS